jgi:hypothetical protein
MDFHSDIKTSQFGWNRMEKNYRPAKNEQSHVLLRKGWTPQRLWIISIIGLAGLGLDVTFHTMDTSALSIVFDGAYYIPDSVCHAYRDAKTLFQERRGDNRLTNRAMVAGL